jgi:Na+/proline symporter
MLTLVGVLYSLAGGLASIIWTDVLQTVVLVGAALAAFALLWSRIPLSGDEIIDLLAAPDAGARSKLTAFGLGLDASRPTLGFEVGAVYTLLTAVFGFSLLNTAAYATDQDLAQRLLTCRSALKGSWSMISAILITVPVTLLFLGIGLLLFVYRRGGSAPTDGRRVFLDFIAREMPPGMAGLMLAGLFAVGFASLLSALNALASAFVTDFYRPLRPHLEDRHYLRVSRLGVAGFGLLLGAFALLCVFWQRAQGQTLIDFALGVMTFAYSGLLAVFLAALFTRRGSSASVVAALIAGAAAIVLMQGPVWPLWAPSAWCEHPIAYPWQMLIGTVIAFGVCCLGRTASAPASARVRARLAPIRVEPEQSGAT